MHRSSETPLQPAPLADRESDADADRAVAGVRPESWPGGIGPPVLLIGGGHGERVAALLRGPLRDNRQPIAVLVPPERRAAHRQSVAAGEWSQFDPDRVRISAADDPSLGFDAAFGDALPTRLRGVAVLVGDATLPTVLCDREFRRLQIRYDQEARDISDSLQRFRSARAQPATEPTSVFGAADRSTTALRHLGDDLVRSAQRLGLRGEFLTLDHLRDPFRPIHRLEALLAAQPDLLLSFVASRERDWGTIAQGIPTLSYWSSDPARYDLASMPFTDDDLVCVSDIDWIETFRQHGVEAKHLPLATGLHDALPSPDEDLPPTLASSSHVLLVGNLPDATDVLPPSLHAVVPAVEAAALTVRRDPSASLSEHAASIGRLHRTGSADVPTIARAIEFAATRLDRLGAAHRLVAAGIPLRIHGCTRWQQALAGSPTGAAWAGPLIDRRSSAIAFRDAAAVVNIVSRNGRDGVNMRVFDVAAAGGILLTNDTVGLRRSFRPGEEVLAFRSVEELPSLVQSLLSDPSRAARIREAGMQRARRDHTWEARWTQVFRWLRERRGAQRGGASLRASE